MADRILVDGGWYILANDGTYYLAYPIKGTPAPGDTVLVNAEGVPEFVPVGSASAEALIDDASGEFLFDDTTGDVLYDG